MAIAIHHEEELACSEEGLRLRASGQRVVRLLRDMAYRDDKRPGKLVKAHGFSIVAAALAAGVLLQGFFNASPTSMETAAAGLPEPATLDARQSPTSLASAVELEYQASLQQAHARAALQGVGSQPPETF